MTDDGNDILSDETRRSFMEKGAVATGAAALGLAGTGTTAAQDGGDGGDGGTLGEGYKGVVFQGEFRPFAHFTFVSGVLEWQPNYAELRDNVWSDYNTYQIRWLDTGEIDTMFVANEASQALRYDSDLGFVPDDDNPNQPAVWQMNQEWSLFSDENLMTVTFNQVGDEEANELLEDDNWWSESGGGNTDTPTGGN